MAHLTFLKLGGSLITDKTRPYVVRPAVLTRIAQEIAAFCAAHPQEQLLIGHGSGSFGHTSGKQYHTRDGAAASGLPPQTYWQGFAETGYQAARLHRHVLEALHAAGLPVLSFPPSSGMLAEDGQPHRWDLTALNAALQAGLLPVVYGDVVFDARRGGTILSTEAVFAYLTGQLHPVRILLAGLENGICADYPHCQQVVPHITPQNYADWRTVIGASHGTDVTGGMAAKAAEMLALAQSHPGLQEIRIFSGEADQSILHALEGQPLGTKISQK